MIYKIPIYFEVEVQGDFVPSNLNLAVETVLGDHVFRTLKEEGGFPHSTLDFFDSLAAKFCRQAKISGVRISLVPSSQVFKKIESHVK